jgi:phosphoribosylanthranilate isomerase
MTSLEDARQAVEAGADAVGFIFFRKSPRFVKEAEVKKIVKALPPLVTRVGVFVNESTERINRLKESCGLDVVQLHGDEAPSLCRKVRGRVIKALRVKNADSLKAMAEYDVEGFLLDGYREGEWGGTGETFNWNWVKRAQPYGPIILAGGLNPANVQEAVRHARPYGVDVCSGVERSPGKKDFQKVRRFIRAVREIK